MDKEWMSKNRLSPEYKNGVESFLQFAMQNSIDPNSISCPCAKCGNLRKHRVDIIKAHLFCNGMDLTYVVWIWHGEKSTLHSSKHANDEVRQCEDNFYDNEPIDMVHAAYEHVEDPNQFTKLLEDAEKPLYPGCTKFTKLSATCCIELQAESMPTSLWVLYCFAKNVLVDGRGICIPIQSDVFGDDSIIHIYLDDILPFCKLEPISYNCIVGYICTLYKKMKAENKVHKFRFVDPYHVGHQPSLKTDKKHRQSQLERRARVLAERLSGTPLGTLVLVPCNVGFHWIMTAIFPHKEIVCLMDPLYEKRNRDEDWYHVVNLALKIFNAENKKRGKIIPTWEMLKVPEQSDKLQCGFFVMRYMREIIQKGVASDSEGSLQQIFNQTKYSSSDIDEVRVEWAECISSYIK